MMVVATDGTTPTTHHHRWRTALRIQVRQSVEMNTVEIHLHFELDVMQNNKLSCNEQFII